MLKFMNIPEADDMEYELDPSREKERLTTILSP